ncbi:uncharacterized protein LOC131020729 [Salvia miltiorrhiza]|uniref:uncharacterized protein LOC131020729 n=1 Tax=Salvia miltiorrhiza TaxID=226208 RepID=UPI0025AC0069|nr:uncharacterized protein LOC131020729 [Salvia miltiorrhiza]
MAATTSKEIPAAEAEISPNDYRIVVEFLEDWGLASSIKPEYNVNDAFSKVVGGVLKLISAHRGKISCILSAKPPVLNGIGRLHGGAVASVAERVAIACAKTVVHKDEDLFLGDLSISYLSSAPRNAEIVVDAFVISSEKKQAIIGLNFRIEETGRLLYLSRATFESMPLSSRL